MSVAAPERPRQPLIRVAVMTLIGLAFGAGAGWSVGHLMKSAHHPSLGWSDAAALLIAMTFIGAGLLTAVFAMGRRGLARLRDPSAPDERSPIPPGLKTYVLLQAAVLLLAGALLIAPVAFVTFGGAPLNLGPPIMAVLVLGFVLQTGLNIAAWRRSDEVQRKVIAESGAACFWIFQGGFFLWAAGEKLKVLPTASSWDAVTVLMGLYLITSTVAFYRRGLG